MLPAFIGLSAMLDMASCMIFFIILLAEFVTIFPFDKLMISIPEAFKKLFEEFKVNPNAG